MKVKNPTKHEIHRIFESLQSNLTNEERRHAHKIIKLTLIRLNELNREIERDMMQ